jgi:hypothetical protein
LAKVVDLIAEVPMEDRDTKGDLYEYMLSKIATAGQNGQSILHTFGDVCSQLIANFSCVVPCYRAWSTL